MGNFGHRASGGTLPMGLYPLLYRQMSHILSIGPNAMHIRQFILMIITP